MYSNYGRYILWQVYTLVPISIRKKSFSSMEDQHLSISPPRDVKCKLTTVNDTLWIVSKTYSSVKEQITLEQLRI